MDMEWDMDMDMDMEWDMDMDVDMEWDMDMDMDMEWDMDGSSARTCSRHSPCTPSVKEMHVRLAPHPRSAWTWTWMRHARRNPRFER